MPATDAAAVRIDVREDGLAILTLDQPGSRANTLSQAMLGELERATAELRKRKDLKGLIVASGKPGMFIAGADLRELGGATPGSEQSRQLVARGLAVIQAIEELPIPTVAVIDGACMGGGLELALGCDYRLAGSHPKTELGLPEVKIGLIPGLGGTQRLCRLIGPALAAEMICAGDAAKADRARAIGLVFDAVPSERLLDEAIRLLHWSIESGDWRAVRDRKQLPVGLSQEQQAYTFTVARGMIQQKTGPHYPAPLAALAAIEKGCNLPLEEGLKIETEQFLPLVGSPVSRNLIAIFFMNQRLQKDPGVADATIPPRPVTQVGVVGAGIMGSGIAGAHIRRGIPAVLLDVNRPALDKGVTAITRSLQGRVAIGRMTPAEVTTTLGLLSTSTTRQALADRDVVVEAIVENEKAKIELLTDVERLLPESATLASNTSTISITRMANALRRPDRFAGLHFFNPVDRMQLVEVIRGEKTSDETVVTLVALAKRIGKTPIVVRDCPGFLVNRVLFPYLNESLSLLEEGADPRALDQAATAFGMPMGPITLSDVVGLDTALYAGRVVDAAFADRARPTRILDELVAAGRLGQKTGAGFYSYAKGTRGIDDPALANFLSSCRTGPQRTFTAEELTDRLFLPLLIEASRVLMDGIVREPADVDMGLLLGIGFPSFRGGILRWADDQGLDAILKRLGAFEALGPRFHPTEQMRRLAAEGKGFYSTTG